MRKETTEVPTIRSMKALDFLGSLSFYLMPFIASVGLLMFCLIRLTYWSGISEGIPSFQSEDKPNNFRKSIEQNDIIPASPKRTNEVKLVNSMEKPGEKQKLNYLLI